jgi:hypothetical protein
MKYYKIIHGDGGVTYWKGPVKIDNYDPEIGYCNEDGTGWVQAVINPEYVPYLSNEVLYGEGSYANMGNELVELTEDELFIAMI